jgi:hypothetical protein
VCINTRHWYGRTYSAKRNFTGWSDVLKVNLENLRWPRTCGGCGEVPASIGITSVIPWSARSRSDAAAWRSPPGTSPRQPQRAAARAADMTAASQTSKTPARGPHQGKTTKGKEINFTDRMSFPATYPQLAVGVSFRRKARNSLTVRRRDKFLLDF